MQSELNKTVDDTKAKDIKNRIPHIPVVFKNQRKKQ